MFNVSFPSSLTASDDNAFVILLQTEVFVAPIKNQRIALVFLGFKLIFKL